MKIKYIPKKIVETIFAIFGFVLYVLFLPLLFVKSLLTRKSLFTELRNVYNLKLKTFNSSFAFIEYLPLSIDVLMQRILIVGTSLHEKSSADFKPGIISLYDLRKRSGINYNDVTSVDKEYENKAGLLNDLKLILKYMITSKFVSKRIVFNPRLELFGVKFLNTTMNEVVDFISHTIDEKRKHSIFFVNADTFNKAYVNDNFKRYLNSTKYVFPDGIGVKLACNMMNNPLKQNINGTDLFPHLCELAQEKKYKIFLYGAKEGIAQKMKEKTLEKYPNIEIVGTLNGYDFNDNEVVNRINHSQADIVLVAKGAPIQEEWIVRNREKISSSIVIGVGGLFDFYSESIPRAPIWMRETGMEWIYRLIQEPRRMWKRYIIGNPLFLRRVSLYKKEQKKKMMTKYYKVIKEERWINNINLDYFSRLTYPYTKRLMDIIGSFIGIILLSPIFIVTALLIKFESKGPIIFKQSRVGKDGKFFPMYKFRSMVVNAEELKAKLASTNESKDGVIFKMKDDPRITKTGKFIRKWSIDELPQLFNVLVGHMSLVGPRPPVPSEVNEYVVDDLKRLHIIPGITCYWQISGRSEIPFKQQVDLDKKYISNNSLWVDIKILFGTFSAVFAQKGAY